MAATRGSWKRIYAKFNVSLVDSSVAMEQVEEKKPHAAGAVLHRRWAWYPLHSLVIDLLTGERTEMKGKPSSLAPIVLDNALLVAGLTHASPTQTKDSIVLFTPQGDQIVNSWPIDFDGSPQYIAGSGRFISMKVSGGNEHSILIYDALTTQLVDSHPGTAYNVVVASLPKGWGPRLSISTRGYRSEPPTAACISYADTGFTGPLRGWVCSLEDGFGGMHECWSQEGNNDEVSLCVAPEFLAWRSSEDSSRGIVCASLVTKKLFLFKRVSPVCIRAVSKKLFYAHTRSGGTVLLDWRHATPRLLRMPFCTGLTAGQKDYLGLLPGGLIVVESSTDQSIRVFKPLLK